MDGMIADARVASSTGAKKRVKEGGASIVSWWGAALIIVSALVVLAIPQYANPYYVKVMAIALIYAYIASAWNIIGGYGGQMSIGHAIFFGIGSYAVGVFAVYKVGPLIYAVPVGMMVSFVVAAAIAVVCFKYGLRGLYFAVGTMLLAEVVRLIGVNWEPLGRSQGLSIVAERGFMNLKFQGYASLYYIICAAVAGIVVFSYWLERSRLGFSMVALREQEESAQSLGIETDKVKRHGFVLSAVLTSIGGSLHAALIGFVDPNFDLSLTISLFMVMGALVGGRGTVWGPIIGGIIVELVQEVLSYAGIMLGTTGAPSLARIVYGLFFVVIVLVLPLGIVGTVNRRRAERRASDVAEVG